ncbi:MAG: ABC transporter permease [Candidatus Thorarchaeota archaeon]|jgi:ABC-2 type transport system permease protein
MKTSLRVMKASFIKEMRVWGRNRQKIALITLMPILFFTSFSLLMGGVYFGSGVETALVVEEQNPDIYTNGLIEILRENDLIPPRLDPILMDEDTADQLFHSGQILLVITIPDGFEDAVANNETVSLRIQVANIHEDLTKNLRMPVIRKLDIFYQTYFMNESLVDFEVENLREFTPPRLAFMAWTMSVYAVMFGAIYASGSAMTQEFEQETMDELSLSGQSPYSIYLGKMMSGVVISYVAPPLLFLLSYLLFGVWPNGDIAIFMTLTLLLAFFSSGIGIALGAIFRNSVFMVPIAALGALFYWIAGGGIAPLEIVGLSFGAVNEYAPIVNVYRSMIRMFIEGSYGTLVTDLIVIGLSAVVVMIVAPFIADKATRIDFGARVERVRQRRKMKSSPS